MGWVRTDMFGQSVTLPPPPCTPPTGGGPVGQETYLPTPAPLFVLFSTKNIDPNFLVGKCIYNGQKKLYTWSHVKINLSRFFMMVQFCHEITVHGHIQSCLNGYIICPKNSRPSVKHVLMAHFLPSLFSERFSYPSQGLN